MEFCSRNQTPGLVRRKHEHKSKSSRAHGWDWEASPFQKIPALSPHTLGIQSNAKATCPAPARRYSGHPIPIRRPPATRRAQALLNSSASRELPGKWIPKQRKRNGPPFLPSLPVPYPRVLIWTRRLQKLPPLT